MRARSESKATGMAAAVLSVSAHAAALMLLGAAATGTITDRANTSAKSALSRTDQTPEPPEQKIAEAPPAEQLQPQASPQPEITPTILPRPQQAAAPMPVKPEPERNTRDFEPGIPDGADPETTVTWIGFADGNDAQVAPYAGVDQAAFTTVQDQAGTGGTGSDNPDAAAAVDDPTQQQAETVDAGSAAPLPAAEPEQTLQDSAIATHETPPPTQPAQDEAIPTPETQEPAASSHETEQTEKNAAEEDVVIPDDAETTGVTVENQQQTAPDSTVEQAQEASNAAETSAETNHEQEETQAPADPKAADPLSTHEETESVPSVAPVENPDAGTQTSTDQEKNTASGGDGKEGTGGPAGAVKDPMAALSDIDTAAASSVRVNADTWRAGKPIAREGMVIKPYPLLRHIMRDSGDTLFSLNGTGGVQHNPIVAVQFDRRGKVGRVEILRKSGLAALDDKYLASWMARWTAADPRLGELKDGELTNPIVFRLVFVPEPDDADSGAGPKKTDK